MCSTCALYLPQDIRHFYVSVGNGDVSRRVLFVVDRSSHCPALQQPTDHLCISYSAQERERGREREREEEGEGEGKDEGEIGRDRER